MAQDILLELFPTFLSSGLLYPALGLLFFLLLWVLLLLLFLEESYLGLGVELLSDLPLELFLEILDFPLELFLE